MTERGNNLRMPILFLGHGSPMNAIETNAFTESLKALGQKLPKPNAVLCVSAHWMTQGAWVTHMPRPRTLHDFYGFPKALFDIQYPAPGSPEIAGKVQSAVHNPKVQFDDDLWGLDHGTWSVLRHVYPKADIPVVQLSIDISQPGDYHYQIGQQLKGLRDQGVLIVGSGNIVHNLGRIIWETDADPFEWATEFDEWSKRMVLERNHEALVNGYLKSNAGRLSVPTNDHYLPLLYVIGATDSDDTISFEYEGIQNASISMRSVSFGLLQ